MQIMDTQTQKAPYGQGTGTCDKCDGQGEFLSFQHGIVRCDKCGGTGEIEYALTIGDAYIRQGQRIEALEKALAFYADRANWDNVCWKSKTWEDRGDIARDALKHPADTAPDSDE